jgi:uncharacterized SAM-binding protein YcdF (DUF218 family)
MAIVATLIVVAIALAWSLVAPFIAEHLVVSRPLNRVDAIIVLAGARDFAPRTTTAAALYKAGVSRRILLTNDEQWSGWFADEQRNIRIVELAKRRLVTEGVPDEAIEILSGGEMHGTIDEARLMRDEAKQRHWHSILIVTSAWHTRRALRTFEKVFSDSGTEIQIGIVPSPARQESLSPPSWWLTRSGWTDVAGEYVKAVYYSLVY